MEEVRKQEVVIKHSFEVKPETYFLTISLVSFILVMLLIFAVLITYLFKPEAFFSPPFTVNSFLSTMNPEINSFIMSETAIEEEKNLVAGFYSSYSDIPVKTLWNNNSLTIGLASSFSDYIEYLENHDALILYVEKDNSFFVYAQDIESLEDVIGLINEDRIPYSSAVINDGIVEELVI